MLHRFWREHRIRSVLIGLLVQQLGAYVVPASYEKKQRIQKARGIRDAICICQVSCAGALGRVGWSMCVRSVIETVMVLVVCRRIRVFVSDNTEVGVVLTEMKSESEV